jgi:hypothetical protein
VCVRACVPMCDRVCARVVGGCVCMSVSRLGGWAVKATGVPDLRNESLGAGGDAIHRSYGHAIGKVQWELYGLPHCVTSSTERYPRQSAPPMPALHSGTMTSTASPWVSVRRRLMWAKSAAVPM